MHPQPRARSVGSTRVSHHGRTGNHPAFPHAMVLTVSFVLSLVTGLSCHHRRRNLFRQLDASVGASGPHDFAVREPGASRQKRSHVHRIPCPTFVTIAKRPFRWAGMARDMQVIWVRREWEYFCGGDWTTQIRLNSKENFVSAVIRFGRENGGLLPLPPILGIPAMASSLSNVSERR